MITVIIPCYNEEENIEQLIHLLKEYSKHTAIEIIVSDGGSTDATAKLALQAGAVVLASPQKGRSFQMNYAAAAAKGNILYFVHADTLVHKNFSTDIEQAVQNKADLGCYRYRFNSGNWLLRINSFFTRLPFMFCRGGDQTLFITKTAFQKLNGYAPLFIMEEYDLLKRACKLNLRFKIIRKDVLVSARKYEGRSYFKIQYANYKIIKIWKKGTMDNKEMLFLYNNLLKKATL